MYNFLLKKIKNLLGINKIQQNQIEIIKATGKLLALQNSKKKYQSINDYEFKVFSQFGDDGIIQFLIENINIKNDFFLEFGVENYEESNTRFLLENNNWAGVIFDSSEKHILHTKQQNYFWKYRIQSFCHFITKENINDITRAEITNPDIGLLCIDVDGNDFWIWKAINYLNPQIVIIEYNARFGNDKSISIPYERNFDRNKKKYKNIIYGASLGALEKLGKEKNYSLIGTNLNGNNAYFIRNDSIPQNHELIKPRTTKECFKLNSFKENRDDYGNIIYLSKDEEEALISKFNLENV